MFDFIFDMFSAFNSLGLMLMALVFLLIGGIILADFFYWRMYARRVVGEITGLKATVREKGARQEPMVTKAKDGKEGKKRPVVVLMFIGIPLIFSGVGLYTGAKYFSLATSGVYAEAHVVRNDSSHDSDSGTTYKAVLAFRDVNGLEWEVKDTISYGNSPSYSVGEIVGVYYDLDKPSNFVIADFWHTMGFAFAFFFFGMLFIGFFVFMMWLGGSQEKQHDSGTVSYGTEYYYPVYSYKAQDGTMQEFVSDMGSTGFMGALPGRRVTLLVMPRPKGDKVRRKGVLGLIFGLLFFLPGLFVGSVALRNFEMSFATGAIIVVAIAFLSMKIIALVQKARRAGVDLKEIRENVKFSDIKITSNTSKGRLLSDAEIAARVVVHRKYLRVGACITFVLSACMMAGGVYFAKDMRLLMQDGQKAQGEVVSFESRSSDGGNTYYAVVEYRTLDGQKARFQDRTGASSPLYKRGDQVEILYLPGREGKAIIDRGFMNWVLSFGLGAGGLVLFVVGVQNFLNSSPLRQRRAKRM